jgi:hypothetical protein
LIAEGGASGSVGSDNLEPSAEAVALVIDGCLYALLGGPASSSFRTYIKNQHSATIAELVEDPEKLHTVLVGVFGDSTSVLEDFMVRSLIREFGLSSSLCTDLVAALRAVRAR